MAATRPDTSVQPASPEGAPLTPAQIRDAVPCYADLPRRTSADLEALAREQGASLPVHFEDLTAGDFWPEDETCDEFNAAVREWRRGAPGPDWFEE